MTSLDWSARAQGYDFDRLGFRVTAVLKRERVGHFLLKRTARIEPFAPTVITKNGARDLSPNG